MRLPITAIPPVISLLKTQLGLSTSAAGWLTTIPLLTFALVSPLLAKLGVRYGNERIILWLLSLLVLGSWLRVIPRTTALLFGTFLLAIGIDAANVLLPASIKDRLPNQPTTGIATYTTTMLVVGAIGTGIAGIMAQKFGLTAVMVLLAVIAIFSLLGWIPNSRLDNHYDHVIQQLSLKQQRSVWNTSLGWLIAIFFGLQALVYYSLLTWLPQIFVAMGFHSVQASNLVTILQLANLPFAFAVPYYSRFKNGVKIMNLALGIGFVGGIGIMWTGLHQFWIIAIAAILAGAAAGIAFNLAVVFFAEKSDSAKTTADISGMAQSAGYVLAAAGPIAFGWIQKVTNSWTPVLIVAVVLSVALFVIGIMIEKRESVFE